MKVRSKALYQFLVETGAIDGTKDDIALARKEYRRKYQRENKRKRKMLKPAVCVSLTHRELSTIKVKAIESGLNYPDYIKQTLLASVEGTQLIHNRPLLEQVLQIVGIAISLFETGQDALAYLNSAEELLAGYLEPLTNDRENPGAS